MHTPRYSFRKIISALALVLFLHPAVHAQDKNSSGSIPFGKGDKTLALGFGFGVDYGYLSGVSARPAFMVTYDQGFFENVGPGTIGIGGIFGFKTARYDYDFGSYDARWTNIIVAARGTYHLTLLADKLPKLDPYGGVMAGFRIWSYNNDYFDNDPFFNDYDASGVTPVTGLFVGAKYNFTPKIGAWSELGYDVSFFKLGVHFNF